MRTKVFLFVNPPAKTVLVVKTWIAPGAAAYFTNAFHCLALLISIASDYKKEGELRMRKIVRKKCACKVQMNAKKIDNLFC